ncbi:BrnT family toxin [Jiella sonneratiae]|uniref:BrnT family toxin n=1 Tax=Jiella sonneratiae TaxID=2816856 RepID=A0ABS3J2N1_9HYPH|nr:BrnT family toxin [Jiella sonneratiae]MBO0903233.1 BrnT family toxin [Jiella sonneratiae]
MVSDFEWDDDKDARNRAKHRMSFRLARRVFLDQGRVTRRDVRKDYGEDRFVTTGFIDGRLVVVVYTLRGDAIRIISARIASSRERSRHGLDPNDT